MKKIFISYSWGTKEHQDWIVNLGTRLMSDSVDVELDRWSLKDGQDIFSFMELMVKSEDIFRVLVICDKNYKEKANERKGGVGTETQIITPEIYSHQHQEKFIPIVIERDENDNPYLPIFFNSRKYIDFSDEEFFEDSYEDLLRNILEAPALPKPKLNKKAPIYITESTINSFATNSSIRTLENQIKKNPERINSYSSRFLELFLEDLWQFQLKSTNQDINLFGDDLINNLKSYKILREDFIQFLLIATSQEFNLDVDELISFFEKEPLYNKPKEKVGGWRSSDFDNFKIIFQELFIYTIAISLNNKNYNLIENLLHSKYYFNNSYGGKKEAMRFTKLYSYHQNLENYITAKYNKITGFGHFVITNLSDKVSKQNFILADTLMYIIGDLFNENNFRDSWFPATYLYKEENGFDFFDKISSKRHFDKIKGIFEVKTPEELKNLINENAKTTETKERIRYRSGFESIPFLHEMIESDKIAINR